MTEIDSVIAGALKETLGLTTVNGAAIEPKAAAGADSEAGSGTETRADT
jgi:hypothetical protein